MISKRRRAPLRPLGLDVMRTSDRDLRAQSATAACRPNIVRFVGVTSLGRTAAGGGAAYEAHVAAARGCRGSSATGAS